MNRAFAVSAPLAACLFLALHGCGGGGPSEAPHATATATTVAPPAAAGSPTTTVAGGKADDEAAPLLAWADATPEEGKAPLAVEFKADVEGGTPPLKYSWTFGDGTPDSTDPNPKHTYEKPGKFRADLNVSDSGGDSDSDYIEIEVSQ